MDTTQELRHISLCAGYAGIDLGLKRAIPDLRTVAFSEIEAYACANLVAKMEAGLLDAAPIWTNLKTFPWGSFRDRVDILSGGYPCQPFSLVGQRLGTEDPRHLWPYIANGIKHMRPRVCFFENVEGHISLGLQEVLGDLEDLGYRQTWGIFSASECGASHERKRVFILAILDDAERTGLEGWIRTDRDAGGREDEDRPASEAVIPAWRRVVFAEECEQCDCCDDAICPNCDTHYSDCGCPGPTQDGIEHLEVRGIVYGRSETRWPQYPAHGIKPVEPPRLITPSERGMGGNDNGSANRVDRLRLCGNGVVPDTAHKAFTVLLEELLNTDSDLL
jgi:DNA (cytosine-5)-methyltransferase 1